jgi:hypothetical protein
MRLVEALGSPKCQTLGAKGENSSSGVRKCTFPLQISSKRPKVPKVVNFLKSAVRSPKMSGKSEEDANLVKVLQFRQIAPLD